MPFSLRGVLIFAPLSLSIVGSGAGVARAQTPVALNISFFTPEGPTAIARATGALASAGLDVTTSVTPSSTEQMRGLSNGTYDVAYTAFDNVLAWSGREGAEIVAVAQLDRSTTLPVYVRPEIADWPDLRGRPLAVDAADTAFALVLRRILLAHGLDLNQDDYMLVPLGATAARVASMINGDTYAGMINPPINRQAEAAGMVLFGDQREVLPNYPGSVIAVRRDWAAQHRDVLVSFLRVWRQAGEFSQAERDQAGAIFGRQADLPTATAVGLLPAAFDDGMLHPDGLQSVLDLRNQFGYALPMGPNLSVYLDSSFWRAAAAAK